MGVLNSSDSLDMSGCPQFASIRSLDSSSICGCPQFVLLNSSSLSIRPQFVGVLNSTAQCRNCAIVCFGLFFLQQVRTLAHRSRVPLMSYPIRIHSRYRLTFLASLLFAILSPTLSAQTASVDEVRAVARLYSAAFDRDPKINGLNFWVKAYEGGSSLSTISRQFYLSPEFTKKYGTLNEKQFVEQLFRNVLGRDGKLSGINFWVKNLQGGASPASVLKKFADSPENVTKTTATFADMRYINGQWTFEPIFTNNLIAESLDIDSSFPRIGYPLEVSVSLTALELTDDVSVAFFAIDKDRANVRQLALDTATIDRVEPGTNTYTLEIEVPTSLEIAGPYYIGALVDAADFIGETNEGDNETSAIVTLSPVSNPNLMIESMEPDRDAIILDRYTYNYAEQAELGVVNSDAGGTVSWRVNGAQVPIEVEVFATIRLFQSDSGQTFDVPLYLWNSEQERYMNAYGIDPETGIFTGREWLPVGSVGQLTGQGGDGVSAVSLSEFDPRSAHLDFYFPGRFADELEIALRDLPVALSPNEPPPDLSTTDLQALKSFLFRATPQNLSSSLCVDIRPANHDIEEDITEDNRACSPLALVLPPIPVTPPPPVLPPVPPENPKPANPLLFQTGFESIWGGEFFGFGVDFSSTASADNRGVIIGVRGALPVQVFGLEVDFAAIEGRAQVLPLSQRDNPPPGQNPGFSLELEHLNQTLAFVTLDSGSIGPLQLFFTKEFKSKEKIVAVDPVPVKLTGGLTGNIGAEYTILFGQAAGGGLALETAPFVNVEAGASASVTVGIADVGVEGVISLVEEKFRIISGASINVLDDRHSDGTSEIVYVPRLQAINEITGAKGSLGVFVSVQVPTVKKCSWGIITGLCPGLKSIKYPYTLGQWSAFQKTDTLLDEQDLISVITLPNGSVGYYQ